MKTKSDLIEEVNKWVNIEYNSIQFVNLKRFIELFPNNFPVPDFTYYGVNANVFPMLTWTIGGVFISVTFCGRCITYKIETDESTLDVRCPMRKAILSLITENIENE